MASICSTLDCPLCGSPSLSLKLYVSHLRLVHSKDPSFNVMCGLHGCREVFRTFAAYSSHIYRHHRGLLGLNHGAAANSDQPNTFNDVTSYGEGSSTSATYFKPNEDEPDSNTFHSIRSSDEDEPENSMSEVDPSTQAIPAARFLLKLREGHQIAQVAIADIVAGTRILCKNTANELKAEVKQTLTDAGICCESIPGLQEVLDRDRDHFKHIDSNYLYEKFCLEHFGCLDVKEIQFGMPYYRDQFSGQKRRKVSFTDKFYYVPLLESLKNLLKLEDFQAELFNSHAQTSQNILGDFCDGSFFKSHQLFSSDPFALQLIAYYDELEIANPIGSYVKKHKLGCMFFFLGNVRPKLRSTFKAIHLVAVGKYIDIVKYGMDTFLAPFIDDIKTLYCDGIQVVINKQEHTFHGSLVAFLADTLAAHAIGGFKGSMSFALRVCRTCMITTPQISLCFRETDCSLRTVENHFEQCMKLSGPLKDHFSTSFGINRLSKLEEIPGFSVINGLPHDIMHDLYEGVMPYHLKILLCHCVAEKYFTIDKVNERIVLYDFASDNPSLIDSRLTSNSGVKIRQSASQMIALSRGLPFLIADMIPVDDEHWHLFLILLKICALAVSPIFTHDNIAYLRVLIEEYLFKFRRLYPNESMLPKHHYMVHYPSQIERLGPLIHSWNMRQESKLCFIKKVSRLSNYKNVCKTVAKKHQFWLCHQIQSGDGLFIPNIEKSSKAQVCPLKEEEDFVRDEILKQIPNLISDTFVEHPTWVKLQSSKFCKGVFIILKNDSMKPIFGKVFDIVIINNRVVLCVQQYYGKLFNAHYNSFELGTHGTLLAVFVDQLNDHRPLHATSTFLSFDTNLYLTLPYTC